MAPDKRKDVAVLVSDIIRKDPSMIHVKDSALIPYYVHNSNYMLEVEPEDKGELRVLDFRDKNVEKDFEGIKYLHLGLAKETGANYIFASSCYENGRLVSIATPFQIISDKEIDFLVRNYYKDVSKEVSEAASNLGINLFDWYYSYYKEGRTYCINNYHNKEELDICTAFQKFVFTLPYEDQVLEGNKEILRHLGFEDVTSILAKEYSEGRYFQEYFKAIGPYRREKIIPRIKALKRNKNHDIFLLKEGFVVEEKSIIDAYRGDTQAFIKNFKELGAESQRMIIEELYKDSFVNPEAIKWLEENYTPLLREVGLSGGKQNDG